MPLKQVIAIIQPSRLYQVLTAAREVAGAPGVIVTECRAFPRGHADPQSPSHGIDAIDNFEVTRVEVVVPDSLADALVDEIRRAAHTGNPGDGKIFVTDVRYVVSIRSALREEEESRSDSAGGAQGASGD